MAKVDFVNQLKALGYDPKEPDAGKIYFEYVIPVGGNIGCRILLGFEIGDNFPMDCPPGPHIKLLEGQWKEHSQNIHESPFSSVVSAGWRYWSRPFKEWTRSEKTVKTYLAHFKNLMMTV